MNGTSSAAGRRTNIRRGPWRNTALPTAQLCTWGSISRKIVPRTCSVIRLSAPAPEQGSAGSRTGGWSTRSQKSRSQALRLCCREVLRPSGLTRTLNVGHRGTSSLRRSWPVRAGSRCATASSSPFAGAALTWIRVSAWRSPCRHSSLTGRRSTRDGRRRYSASFQAE